MAGCGCCHPLAVCCCMSAWAPSTRCPVCISRNQPVPGADSWYVGRAPGPYQFLRKPVKLCSCVAMPGSNTQLSPELACLCPATHQIVSKLSFLGQRCLGRFLTTEGAEEARYRSAFCPPGCFPGSFQAAANSRTEGVKRCPGGTASHSQ